MTIKFPDDFNKISHPVVKDAVQYTPIDKIPLFVSIVGGGFGLYGNGTTSFEIMIGDKVTPFCSAEEVNQILNKVIPFVT